MESSVGAFVVRASSSEAGHWVITAHAPGGVVHVPVTVRTRELVMPDGSSFASLHALVEHYQRNDVPVARPFRLTFASTNATHTFIPRQLRCGAVHVSMRPRLPMRRLLRWLPVHRMHLRYAKE